MNRAKAKCRDTDPNFFFPIGTTKNGGRTKPEDRLPTKIEEEELVARFCWGNDDGIICEIRQECLEYAIENKQNEGVWGGQSSESRRQMRKNSVPVKVRRNIVKIPAA